MVDLAGFVMAEHAHDAPQPQLETQRGPGDAGDDNVPTRTTTSVLLSSSMPPVAADAGVTAGIYTHAGATTTSVLGPFYCKPITGGSCENTEGPLSSAPTRSEQTCTRTHVNSYDLDVTGGWDPHPESVSYTYPTASMHHASLLVATSLDVQPWSVDPVTTTPIGVGQLFVHRNYLDCMWHYCGRSLKRSQLYGLVTHEEGPSGRLGGEHQALWSLGPRGRRCKWQGPGQDRYLKSVCKCAP